MFKNKTKLLKKIVALNLITNSLIFNATIAYPEEKSNIFSNNFKNQSKSINFNPKYIKNIDLNYIESKKSLDEYIIDTGDSLYIEFENKAGVFKEKDLISRDPTNISYLKPITSLENYLLDTNDSILIKFKETPSLNTTVTINKDGEVFLPRIKKAYIKGLTIDELTKLLESRYEEFLINPEIEIEITKFKFISSGIYSVDIEGEIFLPLIKETYVRGLTPIELSNLLQKKYKELDISAKTTVKISTFKKLRILIAGEIRSPGVYEFPAYSIGNFNNIVDKENENTSFDNQADNSISLDEKISQVDENLDLQIEAQNNFSSNDFEVKRPNNKITTLANAILKAGGVTSTTDLSSVEIIRDIPIGKGGGKKRTFVDFTGFINNSDLTSDIRLFDGDRIFFKKLNSPISDQIPKSILSGISPKYIFVNIFGRVENTGSIKLPLESTLSDAIDLTGPIKPLSGKIILIRYNKDGTILKKSVPYSARAKRGSKSNPFLQEGDLISVKNSFLGKSSGLIREITAPFVGIYTTKEIIESFDWEISFYHKIINFLYFLKF